MDNNSRMTSYVDRRGLGEYKGADILDRLPSRMRRRIIHRQHSPVRATSKMTGVSTVLRIADELNVFQGGDPRLSLLNARRGPRDWSPPAAATRSRARSLFRQLGARNRGQAR